MSQFPNKGRGARSALARTIRCQPAYVSQILNGNAHVNLEQADAINQFLGHGKLEARFFLLLVQAARAGTDSLKTQFQEQIREATEAQLVLKNRLGVKSLLTGEDQATYYSAWHYAAIHVILTIPGFQTKESIARHFQLSMTKVVQVLDFLVSVQLAEKIGNQYRSGTSRIHLPNDSPLISKHHSNWRIKCLQSLESEVAADLHYSSVVTLSKQDVTKIKSEMVKTIQALKATIRESPAESIYSLSMDFFEL